MGGTEQVCARCARVCSLPLHLRGAAPTSRETLLCFRLPSHTLAPSDSTEYLLSGKIGQSLRHLVPGVNREGAQQRQDKSPCGRAHTLDAFAAPKD